MMPRIEKIKKRHLLKRKQQKTEIEKIEGALGTTVNIDDKTQLEIGVLDDGTQVLMYQNEILFFEKDNRYFPSLHALLNEMVTVPKVIVDMGAIRFVVNGADIMRPGVTGVDDEVRADSVVAVVDQNHSKPLAVGIATMDADEIRSATKGKVVLSVHHVNDYLWDFTKG
jgi:PUA-domain protein